MQLTITNDAVLTSGRFLDKANNPVTRAIQMNMPWLTDVTASQNRVIAINTATGRKERFILRPAFSPKDYADLVTKNTSVTRSLELVTALDDHAHE